MAWNRNRLAGVLLTAGSAAVLLVPLAAPAQAAEGDLRSQMVHTARYTTAHGYAEVDPGSRRRDFEITLGGVRRLHGRLLTVGVHGTFVGRMRVDAAGRAHLDRHTRVAMRAGNVVRVRTAGGTLVSYGTLRRHRHAHDGAHHD